MAVRHGYGKVAGADALLFAYDTGDTVNSYKGKPATNIATAIQSRGGGVSADPSDLPAVPKSVASAVYCSSKINGSTTSWESLFQYNTSFSVPDGQRFTVSAWVYVPEGKVNNRFNFNCSVDGTNTGLTVGSHDVPTGKWVKIHGHYLNSTGATVSITSTRLETYTAAEWTGTSISCWAINFMVEQSADIPSGYTGSPATALGATRSVSGSLLDLTGKTTANIGSVSFNSNSQITYESGSSDRVSIADPGYPSSATDAFTLEVIFKIPTGADWNNGYYTGIIGRGGYAGSLGINRSTTGNEVAFWARVNGGTTYDPRVSNLSRDVYHHIIGTYDGAGLAKIYHNGEYVAQESGVTTGTFDAGVYNIGGGNSFSGAFGGYGEADDIPIFKLYNRDLTAGEVLNNYNNYKKRFNI